MPWLAPVTTATCIGGDRIAAASRRCDRPSSRRAGTLERSLDGGPACTLAPNHTDQTLVGLSFTDSFRASEFLTARAGWRSRGQARADRRRDRGEGRRRGHRASSRPPIPSPGRSAVGGAVWASLFGLLLGGPGRVGRRCGGGCRRRRGHRARSSTSACRTSGWSGSGPRSNRSTTTIVLLVGDLAARRAGRGDVAVPRRRARLRQPRPVHASRGSRTRSARSTIPWMSAAGRLDLHAQRAGPSRRTRPFAPPSGVPADEPTALKPVARRCAGSAPLTSATRASCRSRAHS